LHEVVDAGIGVGNRAGTGDRPTDAGREEIEDTGASGGPSFEGFPYDGFVPGLGFRNRRCGGVGMRRRDGDDEGQGDQQIADDGRRVFGQ
jgi:hypothetical protein